MAALSDLSLTYRLGGEEKSWLDGMDYVVPSPGVPRENLLLREALARKIPVLSEIELAYRYFTAPLVAITGTNGKSTTTTLIGKMLQADGKKVFLGGNLGAPFIGAATGSWDWGVIEISSFQLEWVDEFRPRIALLLNLTEDHLDRYASFADYCQAKERIFAAQHGADVAILNRDDPLVWAAARAHRRTCGFLRLWRSRRRRVRDANGNRLARRCRRGAFLVSKGEDPRRA